MRRVRIAVGQINTTVGDIEGNCEHILAFATLAKAAGATLVIFPELAVCGYPPEDLLFKPSFARACRRALEELAERLPDIWSVIGTVDLAGDLYNAAAVVGQKRIQGLYHKRYLPTYGVFDEDRYFRAGMTCPWYVFGDASMGITICEDMWYPGGPGHWQAHAGAEILINISASPFHTGKGAHRRRMLVTRAVDYATWVVYCNLVGGQDELVFDGQSLVIHPNGTVVAEGHAFREDLIVVDLDLDAVLEVRLHEPRPRKLDLDLLVLPSSRSAGEGEEAVVVVRRELPGFICLRRQPLAEPEHVDVRNRGKETAWDALMRGMEGEKFQDEQEIYAALVLGVRDYVYKNGMRDVVVGMSGGIDSSLVTTIAVDALGREYVHGIAMPSRYNASASEEDARLLAQALEIDFRVIPIEPIFQAFLAALEPSFAGYPANVAEENIQARIRGSLWMALTNKFGWIALTAGNKSEMATGYATLYGDMAGGFAVLKDVPKTLIYRLARFRNAIAAKPLIPRRVLEKAPSAELRPNQKDTDSLPPYEELDAILEAYIERDWDFEHFIAAGYRSETVERVLRLIDGAEYKRRQAPPGIKITPRAFGRDRRLPITNHFRERWPEE